MLQQQKTFMQAPEVKMDFAYQLPRKQDVNNMIPGNTNADVQYAELDSRYISFI